MEIKILSIETERSEQTADPDQIAPSRSSLIMSTLFATPSASFGHPSIL